MNLEKAAELYEVDRDELARVLERHRSYPHDVIGLQEYREAPDSQILRDDDEYLIICVGSEGWDHEMRHLMDEDMDIGYDPELARALQKVYLDEANRLLDRDITDIESRYMVFQVFEK
jgi:hypothetical protein